MKTFNEKVQELKELKTMLTELQAEITAAEDSIKKEMQEQGKDEIICGAFIVRYKTVQSSRIDTQKLKHDHPDIAKECTTKTTSKRFTIV